MVLAAEAVSLGLQIESLPLDHGCLCAGFVAGVSFWLHASDLHDNHQGYHWFVAITATMVYIHIQTGGSSRHTLVSQYLVFFTIQ